jgi:hypothetical protein
VLRSGVLPAGVVVESVCAVSQSQVVGSARRGMGIAVRAPAIGEESRRWWVVRSWVLVGACALREASTRSQVDKIGPRSLVAGEVACNWRAGLEIPDARLEVDRTICDKGDAPRPLLAGEEACDWRVGLEKADARLEVDRTDCGRGCSKAGSGSEPP